MKPFLVLLLLCMAAAVSVPSLRAQRGQRGELSGASDACPDGMATCKAVDSLCGSVSQIYHAADDKNPQPWCNYGSVMGLCKGVGSQNCCDNRESVKKLADKCAALSSGHAA